MPPQRVRNAVEDSRSEASSTREKYTGLLSTNTVAKGRRNGNATAGAGSTLKDVTNATNSMTGLPEAVDNAPKINWSSFDASVLHAYRHVHHLDVPSAFTNPYNERMLTRPGIGLLSPTMARHRDRRRVSKDRLAMAVRKDSNAAMIPEPEMITTFLYAVHNQDKNFRMRFEPAPTK